MSLHFAVKSNGTTFYYIIIGKCIGSYKCMAVIQRNECKKNIDNVHQRVVLSLDEPEKERHLYIDRLRSGPYQ